MQQSAVQITLTKDESSERNLVGRPEVNNTERNLKILIETPDMLLLVSLQERSASTKQFYSGLRSQKTWQRYSPRYLLESPRRQITPRLRQLTNALFCSWENFLFEGSTQLFRVL